MLILYYILHKANLFKEKENRSLKYPQCTSTDQETSISFPSNCFRLEYTFSKLNLKKFPQSFHNFRIGKLLC